MKTRNKTQMRKSVSAGRRMSTEPAEATLADAAAASAKQTAIANRPKAIAGTKPAKQARQPARSLRVAPDAKKLVCRYCGGDDLAPSFVKRRDPRCRGCFKQRYGSAVRSTKPRPTRQAKSAK